MKKRKDIKQRINGLSEHERKNLWEAALQLMQQFDYGIGEALSRAYRLRERHKT